MSVDGKKLRGSTQHGVHLRPEPTAALAALTASDDRGEARSLASDCSVHAGDGRDGCGVHNVYCFWWRELLIHGPVSHCFAPLSFRGLRDLFTHSLRSQLILLKPWLLSGTLFKTYFLHPNTLSVLTLLCFSSKIQLLFLCDFSAMTSDPVRQGFYLWYFLLYSWHLEQYSAHSFQKLLNNYLTTRSVQTTVQGLRDGCPGIVIPHLHWCTRDFLQSQRKILQLLDFPLMCDCPLLSHDLLLLDLPSGTLTWPPPG